jgi:hypothetical protein
MVANMAETKAPAPRPKPMARYMDASCVSANVHPSLAAACELDHMRADLFGRSSMCGDAASNAVDASRALQANRRPV